MARSALFLDRDGTLIVDVGYPRDPARVELLPDAARALVDAQRAGLALVVVSNQSGVARGKITPDEATAVQRRVEALFAAEGVTFDAAFFCFHGPEEGCRCRKPAPGLLLAAARDLGLDCSKCVMIGDKASDVDAGRAAGCAPVGFGAEHATLGAKVSFPTWAELAPWLRRRFGVSD